MRESVLLRLASFVGIFALIVCRIGQTAEPVEGDRKIAPLDIIIIDVVGENDLSKELRVSSSGTITFPFPGSLEVKGKTPAEVEDMLKEKLGILYLLHRQVIVGVRADPVWSMPV